MRLVALGLCLFGFLSLPAAATAAVFTDEGRIRGDPTVTPTESPVATFNVRAKFESISFVCLDFTFQDDLLDPGESFRILWIEKGQEIDGGGAGNLTASPQGSRTLCFSPTFQPELIPLFLDGKQRAKFQTVIREGEEDRIQSVKIASIQLTIFGTPR